MTSNIIDSPQLDAFKQRFIDAQGWDEQEAKLHIRDGNACVENGRLRLVPPGETTPAGSHPVFEVLTPIGWRVPIRIARAILMGAHKARRPREIVEEALARIGPPPETAAKGALSDLEIKRHCAHWHEQPVSQRQAEFLTRSGLNTTSIRCKGHDATLIIGKLTRRHVSGLATYKQLTWLRKLGIPPPHLVIFSQAREILGRAWGRV